MKNLTTQYIPSIWEAERVDEILAVSPKEAEESARLLALQEGLFVGPSSGTIFHIARKNTKEIEKGIMVAIVPDGGEK